jgi:hypothetical protein
VRLSLWAPDCIAGEPEEIIMAEERDLPALIVEKLLAFERLEPAFESSFQYVQEVQGQKRFADFPIGHTVGYFHALVVCDRKDHLLSVPRTADRYEGELCLELLRRWQSGASADVVAFLQRKLDALPFADITRELEAARRAPERQALAERLAHGRLVLLNRGINLYHALEPIFTLAEDELTRQVRAACEQFGHSPSQIEEQLRELSAPVYSFVRHPALAQRNMLLMDRAGIRATSEVVDRPGNRSWRVAVPAVPPGPYAEQVIAGYVALTAPLHNNINGTRFVDRPESFNMPPHVQEDARPGPALPPASPEHESRPGAG